MMNSAPFLATTGISRTDPRLRIRLSQANGERHGGQGEAGGGVAGRALATRFPPKIPILEATHHGEKE